MRLFVKWKRESAEGIRRKQLNFELEERTPDRVEMKSFQSGHSSTANELRLDTAKASPFQR